MSEKENTPVAGVPTYLQSEDTGPIRAKLAESVGQVVTPPPGGFTAHAMARAMVDLMGTAPPPPGSPPINLKRFRAGNWLVQAAIGLVIAATGTYAAYKATEVRSVDNEKAIRIHEGLPSHAGALQDAIKIRAQVGGLDKKIDSIAEGVDGLKKESQTNRQLRLEEKLIELERENRLLEKEARKNDNTNN